MVRLEIYIDQEGRVHHSGVISGRNDLAMAARDAAAKYLYKPFKKDGKAIFARTRVEFVFSLPNPKNIFHPPPPPDLTLESFVRLDEAIPLERASLSPELRKWLVSYLKKMMIPDSSGESGPNGSGEDLLDEADVIEIPTNVPKDHLYIVRDRMSGSCGATGNCNAQIVEGNARGVRLVADSGGWGFYVNSRPGSSYPDIFFVWHMSALEADVDGYGNVRGEWIPLYCGTD